jgi:hypothetical protein
MAIKIYTVLNGQNVYDVALLLYGNPSVVGKLCADNNLGFDSILNGGDTLVYDTTYQVITPNQIDITLTPPIRYGYYTGRYGQTIYDICLITYGKFELLTKLCQDNGIVSFDNISAVGITFKYDLDLVNDNKLFAYLRKLGTGFGGTEYIIPTPPPPIIPYYLLLEDDFYILQENDFKIEL